MYRCTRIEIGRRWLNDTYYPTCGIINNFDRALYQGCTQCLREMTLHAYWLVWIVFLNVLYLVTVLSNDVTWCIVHLHCLPPYQHGWGIGKFCCNRRWYPATYSDQLVPDNRNTKRHLVPHGAVTRKIIVTWDPILQLNVSRKVILT